MNEIIFILLAILFSLLIVLMFQNHMKERREKDDKRWEEIKEHNRKIREESNRRMLEFRSGDKVWAKRSDHHNWEKAEIVNFKCTSVFLEYFRVKFNNGDIKPIDYFSIKKMKDNVE